MRARTPVAAAALVVSLGGGAYALTRSGGDRLEPLCLGGVTVTDGTRVCAGPLVYRSREITTAEMLRLDHPYTASVPFRGRQVTYVFDDHRQADEYANAQIAELLGRRYARFLRAFDDCFADSTATSHGPRATLVVGEGTVRVWPVSLRESRGAGNGTAWFRRFLAPGPDPRRHAASSGFVWSWAAQPTRAQDSALRERLATCGRAGLAR